MTNQQLKAHCEDVIANPQDHLDWVVGMARVTLASLGAKPVGEWVVQYYRDEDGSSREAFASMDKEPDAGAKLYTAPPVPELKPIELPNPIQQHETCKYGLEPSDAYGLYWGSKEMLHQCIKAIRAAGYEVKS